MTVTAFYRNRRGAHCIRPIRDAAEAEKILSGGYGAVEVELRDDKRNTVGERRYAPELDFTGRRKYHWYYDPDAFAN